MEVAHLGERVALESAAVVTSRVERVQMSAGRKSRSPISAAEEPTTALLYISVISCARALPSATFFPVTASFRLTEGTRPDPPSFSGRKGRRRRRSCISACFRLVDSTRRTTLGTQASISTVRTHIRSHIEFLSHAPLAVPARPSTKSPQRAARRSQNGSRPPSKGRAQPLGGH